MFPVDQSFAYAAYIECAVIGLVLGIISGMLACLIVRLPLRPSAVALDGALGSIACAVITDLLWRMHVHWNFIVPVIAAIVIPAYHERRRLRSQSK